MPVGSMPALAIALLSVRTDMYGSGCCTNSILRLIGDFGIVW